MAAVKIIFYDLDGTLIDHKTGCISPKTVEEIALPENIQAYSIAIRGIRHTYRHMAASINR